MNSLTREQYRERLSEGQIVYYVEPDNVLGRNLPDSVLSIKKGSVETIRPGYRYIPVAIWRNLNEEPAGAWTCVTLSPRQIFTTDEVQELIGLNTELGENGVDNLIQDPQTHRRLRAILLAETFNRLGKDIHKPLDPEY